MYDSLVIVETIYAIMLNSPVMTQSTLFELHFVKCDLCTILSEGVTNALGSVYICQLILCVLELND